MRWYGSCGLLLSALTGVVACDRGDEAVDTTQAEPPSGSLTVPPPSCAATDSSPSLPTSIRGESVLEGYFSSATVTCARTWSIEAWGGWYTTAALDAVVFHAWDLGSGTLIGAFDGERRDFSEYGSERNEVWGIDLRGEGSVACNEATHLAFTVSAMAGGEDLTPKGFVEPDTPIAFDTAHVGSSSDPWSVTLRGGSSDAVWIWMIYPLLDEVWGPFPAVQEAGGEWSFTPDESFRAVLSEEQAVIAAIGCASGSPLGTATFDFH